MRQDTCRGTDCRRVRVSSAVEAMVGSAVFYNSNVSFVAGGAGDIVTDQSRTTIKDNKTKIGDLQGNVAAGSSHFSQVYSGTIDVAKLREFADLISDIADKLDLAPEERAELASGADELRARL
jgi:hydroxyethylthiazole kinase-like sugar kinase family protein